MMYDEAISHFLGKVPLKCLLILICTIIIVDLLDLININYNLSLKQTPHLLLLWAIYFIILSCIICIKIMINCKKADRMSFTKKLSNKQYEDQKQALTKKEIQKLKQSKQFKKWQDHTKTPPKTSFYLFDDDSDQDQFAFNEVTCHEVATKKKIF